ncbi:MAG: hypothetical protein HYY36_00170 [Gammaproteobacteria bacterium]|nr:hypothetical protein [Gammaproteobacteria bacterium]
MVHSVCPHDCPDCCSILSHIRDGRLISIEGNPAHPVTRGFICRKFLRAPKRIYASDRLRHPMIRAGRKGEGRFRRGRTHGIPLHHGRLHRGGSARHHGQAPHHRVGCQHHLDQYPSPSRHQRSAPQRRPLRRRESDSHPWIYFAACWRHKDAAYALASAKELKLHLPTSTAATELFRRAVEEGLGEKNSSVIIELLRRACRTS